MLTDLEQLEELNHENFHFWMIYTFNFSYHNDDEVT